MAFSLIAFIAPNYRDNKNEWLKAYEPGTTTPKAMALDSGGVTQVAKLQLNADGFLVSAGDALVIPYIDGSYDLWLFPTEAEADANNTTNAIRLADDINSLNVSIINDLSQTYDFATITEYRNFATVFPDGKQIRLLDRYATYTKASGTGSGNDTKIIDSTAVSQNIVFNDVNGGLVNVRQMGVVGDGVTDDTIGLRAALTFSAVRGIREFNVRTTEMILVENECQFNGMGMSLLGETTADAEPWLSLRHDDIDIEFVKFGNGTLTGKPIVIGDYDNPDTVLRRFGIHTNKFNIGDMTTNRGIISAVGKVFELDVSNKNRFQSGAVLTGKNIACVYMQLSTAVVDFETKMAWSIDKNTSVGIPYLFNNFSNAFSGGVSINRNTVRDGEFALRTYHLYDCMVSKNTFIDCTETMYIWQRSDFIGNTLRGCGDGVAAVKFETPSSTQITDNNIIDSNGAGAILDGGNSNYTFKGNNIWQSSGDGLIVNPTFAFGGQIIGMVISGNRITDNFGHGITTKVTSTLRNMVIEGNYIAGNGRANVSQVAGIHFDTTANLAINELTIKNNTIRNNDVVGGVQNANTKWALQFDGGSSFSNSYVFSNNYTYTDLAVVDSRASGSGVGTVSDNLVQLLPDPAVLGVAWFGNYDTIQAQTSARRLNGTPVGVLTPNFFGEEVYDVNNTWYKGGGTLAGPWTNTEWKAMT